MISSPQYFLNLIVFSSIDQIQRPYRMVFNAVNQLPIPINVLWEQNGVKNVLYVQPGDKVTINQPVANNNKIILTAFEAGTSNSVLVNGAREFNLNPSSSDNADEPAPPQDVNLTQSINFVFYPRIFIVNTIFDKLFNISLLQASL